MDTILHNVAQIQLEREMQKDNNLLHLLSKKVVRMFNKESHTVGEYLLLYGLVFISILLFLLFMELLVL